MCGPAAEQGYKTSNGHGGNCLSEARIMIRNILLYPDKRLETPCEPVEKFDSGDLHQLVADIFESMYFHGGRGLAAPQIGVLKQTAVIDPSWRPPPYYPCQNPIQHRFNRRTRLNGAQLLVRLLPETARGDSDSLRSD
jgi:hypothetical protein